VNGSESVTADPFFSVLAGAGWPFHEDVRFSLYGGYIMIKFPDGYYDGVSVGVRLDYLF
jgi:hypothetical protein